MPKGIERISVVLPCLNEEKNISFIIPEIIRQIPKNFNFEIICVDDGSRDQTPVIIKKLAKKDRRIKGLILRKRFGQQMALRAGINESTGDAVIAMDADFQHPSAMIPKMIEHWQKGNDLILGQKKLNLRDRKIRGVVKQIGYLLWEWVSDGILTPGVSEFMLMDRKIVTYIKKAKEHESFLRGLASLAAVNPRTIPYKVGKRRFGSSGYTLPLIYNLFVNGIVSFSTKPLRVTTLLGLLVFLSSLVFLISDLVAAIVFKKEIVAGYLTIVFLMALLNGFIIFYLGILGEYIGVIFREVKKRPKYIIGQKINL